MAFTEMLNLILRGNDAMNLPVPPSQVSNGVSLSDIVEGSIESK